MLTAAGSIVVTGALVMGGLVAATPTPTPTPSATPTAASTTSEPETAVQSPPTTRPDAVTVRQGDWAIVDVLANDDDSDGDVLTLVSVGALADGETSVVDNRVRLRSSAAVAGTQTVTYLVSDGAGDPVPGEIAVSTVVPTGQYRLSRADVEPEPIVAGRRATITAGIRALWSDGTSTPAPLGTGVAVLFQRAGSDGFQTVSSPRLTSEGSLVATITPRRDGRWRVRAGTAMSAGDVVDVHTPTRRYRIGRTDVRPEGRAAGYRATLTARAKVLYSDGKYRGVPVGTVAAIQFRRGSTRYVTKQKVTVTDHGQVTATVRPRATGKWRVRIRTDKGLPDRVRVVRPRPGVGVSVSGPLTRADVPHSFRPGCPVGPDRLRRIRVNHQDYRGNVSRGTVIVRKDAVTDLVHVFTRAYQARFPIKRMRPMDVFYDGGRRSPEGSDIAAMNAGNTAVFNCRPVVGNPYRLSAHSYGVAIDINTFENPYVTASRVYPAAARAYLDRSRYRTGMILRGGAIERAMRERGWFWGARWSYPDYQHFSANGA